MATEPFENTADLFAAIISQGVSSQLKRGLGREYVAHTEAVSLLRGKVEVSESVKTRSVLRRQMVCSYDEFSVDTPANRIVKATMVLLLRADIPKVRKKELKRLLVFFSDVSDVELASVDWQLRYDRNNQTYRMLVSVCWLTYKGLLQTQADGTSRIADFLDEQRMSRLYEKFILEYYRREHKELTASASYIAWALDDDSDAFLPAMKSDIMLSRGGRVLIIDAKYYARNMQQQFDKKSIHSANLYQIFTYVKNKEAELARVDGAHEVSGMLLYAKTDAEVQPEGSYSMSGNKISVRTLDLDAPFECIRAQLDSIARDYFGAEPDFESLTCFLPEFDDIQNRVQLSRDLEKAICDFVDNRPDYGLNDYVNILECRGIQWGMESMRSADVSSFDGQAVMALLVGAMRGSLHAYSHILDLVGDDCVKTWLLRLQELDAAG